MYNIHLYIPVSKYLIIYCGVLQHDDLIGCKYKQVIDLLVIVILAHPTIPCIHLVLVTMVCSSVAIILHFIQLFKYNPLADWFYFECSHFVVCLLFLATIIHHSVLHWLLKLGVCFTLKIMEMHI